MKVLYDISILGLFAESYKEPAGIPRAVEELGLQLKKAPDCSVTFCATESPGNGYRYASRNHGFRDEPFASNPYLKLHETVLNRVTPALNSSYQAINAASSSHPARLLHRARVAGLYRIREGLPKLHLGARHAGRADLFHTPHSPIPHDLRRFKNLAFFQTIYDMIPFLMPDKFTDDMLKFYHDLVGRLRPCDWIFTDSQSAKDDFCEYAKFDADRVFVTHLAADQKKFRFCDNPEDIEAVRRKYALPDAPYLLSLCTFEPRKNLDHVIRSFVRMIGSESGAKDLHLVLAGKRGWDFEATLAQLSEVSSVRERIHVTGYVDDADLAPLYSGATAFLYLSLYEGFGLPVLEAMQCGTPVITSNTSSLPEVVGDAGIMLDPTDQDGLCQAMLDVYNKPEMRSQMAAKSLAQAAKFSWERCAAETIKAYKTAVAAR